MRAIVIGILKSFRKQQCENRQVSEESIVLLCGFLSAPYRTSFLASTSEAVPGTTSLVLARKKESAQGNLWLFPNPEFHWEIRNKNLNSEYMCAVRSSNPERLVAD